MTDHAHRAPHDGPTPAVRGWVWGSLSYATFGLLVADGKVVDAAPIARWTVGKPERQVADYFRRKGVRFERLPEP